MCSWKVCASENNLWTNMQWHDENLETSSAHKVKEENFRILKMPFLEFLDIITSGGLFASLKAYVSPISPIWRHGATGGRQIANLAKK